MRAANFDFDLPPELIAQQPAPRRDQSRLLVLGRACGEIAHRQFRNLLEYFRQGDVLVLNNSRVIPARLRGANAHTGGQFEILLLEENGPNDWWVMLRPGKRARVGTQIVFHGANGNSTSVHAIVVATNAEGHRRLRFSGAPDIAQALDELGEVPLPPYIVRSGASELQSDKQRYQTVFAEPAGSVAAPTAGLHFTEKLLNEIRARGVEVRFLTLHVGLGTFAPVKTETIAAHVMHEERYDLGGETARTVNEAKVAGRRVIAVGTTTVRVLESAAHTADGRADSLLPVARPKAADSAHGEPRPAIQAATIVPGSGRTSIFIYPPYRFKIVDALLTNFHLPHSTLLMLVSAFAAPGETRGREVILSAYAEAIRERYRFFSYGDAMLIL